ncbi:HAD domain-containing protein [Kitasatospora sp. NPDC058218]|uniref:HAD domain-containing protein n=1 Tax=Kitasatospora sp. NPDC058218 TaxID=3346385 RepID=UPI0036DF6850
MTDTVRRPLLFLDVDGPLIPFGGAAQQYPTGATDPEPFDAAANPLLARIDPEHGRRLAALPCELVWATTWMADANECIAPRIGLPHLAVVAWPEPSGSDDQDEQDEQEERDERAGLHWKTRALVAWAAGRPFVWVDDEVTDADRAWVAANHRGPALLHRVDPRLGLTDGDFAAIESWLRQLF